MLLKAILLFVIASMPLQNEVSGEYSFAQRKFPSPLKVGMSIQVEGVPSWFGGGYKVYLQEGTDSPDGDVQLHLSFKFETDDPVLAINSFQDGKWQTEESHDLQYEPETVRIFARNDHWEILVDGGNSYTFKYRKPKKDLKKIKFLVVKGSFKTELVAWCSELL